MSDTKLGDAEVQERLEQLEGWSLDAGGMIRRTFIFPTFLDGILFVEKLAHVAESIQHHPDMDIRYNKTTVAVTTHDAGGLTEKDFALAQAANELAA